MTSLARRVLAAALACVGMFGLDALAFRTSWYSSHLKLDSTTGLFEMILWRERQAQQDLGDNVVLAVGDSRFGLVPKISNALEPETGLVFRSAGVAGTDARSWFYMLRDLDPTASRYRAIVFALDDYDDEDKAFAPDDDIRALHYSIARLRLTDVAEFAGSFRSFPNRFEAFRGGVFKGLVYQEDLHDFLVNPRQRIRDVKFNRGGYEEWTYSYLGSETSMSGLNIDWPTLAAQFPPGATPNQVDTVSSFLLRKPEPQTGRMAAFRRLWFGRILNFYANSRTRILFLRLPRGPIPRPAWLARSTGSVVRDLAAKPNVLLMEEHLFEPLEHPEFFADGMHMNKQGVAPFSTMLAREVSRMLAAAR